MNILNKKISSIDIEGNGGSPPEIVEIAIVTLENGVVSDHKSWLIKPENKISWHATKIHGIHNRDLIDMPSFKDIKSEILDRVKGTYLLAHNVSVEKNILQRLMPEWEPLGFLDTLSLSKKVIPNINSYSLTNLVQELKLEPSFKEKVLTKAHRAEYDAYATASLCIELIKLSEKNGISVHISENVIQQELF